MDRTAPPAPPSKPKRPPRRVPTRLRHTLRLVSPERPRQRGTAFRHVAPFGTCYYLSVECWTEPEWAELLYIERPAGARHVPGFGWLLGKAVTEAEYEGIEENREAELESLDD